MTFPTPQPLVRCDGVEVRYAGFRLGPLDLAIGPGERIALLGPNGAGKSTLLRVLGGRVAYTGKARVAGEEVRGHEPRVRGRVGFLGHGLPGYAWMTVEEHLGFLSGVVPSWDRVRARTLCQALGVDASTRLGTLSRGSAARVGFVAAEAHRPPLLLLDEPTSGLDPDVRAVLLRSLDEALRDAPDRALVFSTHILEDVLEIADRVLVLGEGRLAVDRRLDDRPSLAFLRSLVRSSPEDSGEAS